MEYKGRKFPSTNIECYGCENRRKHEEYLKQKRKYSPGEKIVNFSELIQETYVFCGFSERPLHIEAVKSWQVRIVLDLLQKGRFYKAIKKESEEKWKYGETLKDTKDGIKSATKEG